MADNPTGVGLPEADSGMPETAGNEPSNRRGGSPGKNSRGDSDRQDEREGPDRGGRLARSRGGLPSSRRQPKAPGGSSGGRQIPASSRPAGDIGMPQTAGNEASDYRGRPTNQNTLGSSESKGGSAPSLDNLRNREQAGPSGGSSGGAADAAGLKSAEHSGGSLYRPTADDNEQPSRIKRLIGTRKRKIGFGGGIVGIIILAAMFFIAPALWNLFTSPNYWRVGIFQP